MKSNTDQSQTENPLGSDQRYRYREYHLLSDLLIVLHSDSLSNFQIMPSNDTINNGITKKKKKEEELT